MLFRKNKKGWEDREPSVRKNYIYNLIYQVLTLLTPFITTPYISRILGPEGTGIQSYTNSVVQYFAILAALGTASYGQREIARHRDDKKERSRIFWELELLCAATTAVCLIVWMGVIGFSQEYRPYYAVLTLTLAAVALDISWFFGGLEQYGLIVLRNLIIKAAGILMLFLFIKSREDLLLYVGLIAATGFLGNLSMWGYLRHFLVRVDWRALKIRRHFKETLVYFVPTIATSVYTILDKTMLGWFTGGDKTQNGYCEHGKNSDPVLQCGCICPHVLPVRGGTAGGNSPESGGIAEFCHASGNPHGGRAGRDRAMLCALVFGGRI